ncbi:unnamed protein product, partial [marine sediment metagenome]
MKELTTKQLRARPTPFVGGRVWESVAEKWLTVVELRAPLTLMRDGSDVEVAGASWRSDVWSKDRLPGEEDCPADPKAKPFSEYRVGDEFWYCWAPLTWLLYRVDKIDSDKLRLYAVHLDGRAPCWFGASRLPHVMAIPRQEQKQYEGSKAKFLVNGTPIGYATDVSGEEDIKHEPTEVLKVTPKPRI